MTLNESIKKDLTELYFGKEISAAKDLSAVLEVSTKGLPQHFVGNLDAKTVFVQLNPGKDVASADENFKSQTAGFDRTSADTFIESYIRAKADYGKLDAARKDSFDVKQAAFLKHFADSGIDIPADFPEQKTDELCLKAKEAVLTQKCQLELIPYCSAKFQPDKKNLGLLIPYIETLLDEIFRVERKYVIFGGTIFSDIFEQLESNSMQVTLGEKQSWQCGVKNPCAAQTVQLTKDGKTVKAVIAHSFARQDLTNAYPQMAEYGKKCYELLNH